MHEFTAVVRARELVRQVGITAIPVGMDHYLKAAKASCRVRHDFPDDVSGNTTPIAGQHCIFVNGRHSLERQRFTILHEIAHIVLKLPSVHESLIKSATLMSYAKRPPEEVCCDAFAAECLLPHGFFKKDVDRQDMGLDSVEKLATAYQASLTCMYRFPICGCK
jgi:Zn-dependent peptidase ImmA (M78 family)